MSLKQILGFANIYSLFQRCIVKDNAINDALKELIDAKDDSKILDIGCGPANVLNILPDGVQYWGYDLSENYINAAREKYKNRTAIFKMEAVSDTNISNELINSCDIVLALGLIHHLNDEEVEKLYALATLALRNGGKLVTLDNYLFDKQNYISKFLIKNDRGKFVRTKDRYIELAKKSLGENIKITTKNNLMKVPYDHIFLEWIK